MSRQSCSLDTEWNNNEETAMIANYSPGNGMMRGSDVRLIHSEGNTVCVMYKIQATLKHV